MGSTGRIPTLQFELPKRSTPDESSGVDRNPMPEPLDEEDAWTPFWTILFLLVYPPILLGYKWVLLWQLVYVAMWVIAILAAAAMIILG